MTRGEAIKDFFYKTILPVAAAALLYCIFRSACVKNGELDYIWLWILCGLPFGIWRLRLWIIPGGGSLGGVVCAADGVETNEIIIMQKAGLQSHFLLEITALLICADIFYENVLSFYIRLRKDAGGKAFCFV